MNNMNSVQINGGNYIELIKSNVLRTSYYTRSASSDQDQDGIFCLKSVSRPR